MLTCKINSYRWTQLSYITLFSVFKVCSVQRFSNLKWWENLKQISIYPLLLEACVAEQVTPQTPDLKVCGSSVPHRVVFLDKELYSTLSLFNQVFKWVLRTCCWGLALTLQWTLASCPSSRGSSNTPRLQPFRPLACGCLYLYLFSLEFSQW